MFYKRPIQGQGCSLASRQGLPKQLKGPVNIWMKGNPTTLLVDVNGRPSCPPDTVEYEDEQNRIIALK